MAKKQFRLAVRSKDKVDALSWRTRSLGKGVSVLEAKEEGSSKYRVYTYRFDVKDFTLHEAREYLEELGVKELRMNELRQNLGDRLHGILQEQNKS